MEIINEDLGMQLVRKFEQAGADNAEVFLEEVRKLEVMIDSNVITQQAAVRDVGAGIRVLFGKKQGFVYINDLTPSVVARAARSVIHLAKASWDSPLRDFAKKGSLKKIDGLFHKEVANITAEEFLEKASTVINSVKEKDSRANIVFSRIQTVTGGRVVCTSQGQKAMGEGTLTASILFGTAREGNVTGSFVEEINLSPKNNIDFEKAGKELAKKAIRGLSAEKAKNDLTDVVLAPTSFPYFLYPAIVSSINGENAFRKRSFWTDRICDSVVSDSLTLKDLCHRHGKLSSTPFDDEGSPTREKTIIDKGVFKNYLYNISAAIDAGEDIETTGHAVRGSYTSIPLQIEPHGVQISPGDISFNEAVEDIKKGVYIQRFSGSVEPETGSFSGVAKQALKIEKGILTSIPLEGLMISGNIYESLNAVEFVCSDVTEVYGSFEIPSMRIGKVKLVTH